MPGSVRHPRPGSEEWGNDLIPPDTIRRCIVCAQPIEHLSQRRTTCGHPRCLRANRARRARREPRLKPVATGKPRPAYTVREDNIRKMWDYARGKGADPVTAYVWISKKVGISINEVVAEVKEIERKRAA